MVYYNPQYNWVGIHPLYNPTNQGPFFRGSFELLERKSHEAMKHSVCFSGPTRWAPDPVIDGVVGPPPPVRGNN